MCVLQVFKAHRIVEKKREREITYNTVLSVDGAEKQFFLQFANS